MMMTVKPELAQQIHSMALDQLVWHPVDSHSPRSPGSHPLGRPVTELLRCPLASARRIRIPHTHNRDERVIQLRRRAILSTKDETKETDAAMEPGDCLMMPAGVAHVSAAEIDEESLFITMGCFRLRLRRPG
jgi:hypothetical protein